MGSVVSRLQEETTTTTKLAGLFSTKPKTRFYVQWKHKQDMYDKYCSSQMAMIMNHWNSGEKHVNGHACILHAPGWIWGIHHRPMRWRRENCITHTVTMTYDKGQNCTGYVCYCCCSPRKQNCIYTQQISQHLDAFVPHEKKNCNCMQQISQHLDAVIPLENKTAFMHTRSAFIHNRSVNNTN